MATRASTLSLALVALALPAAANAQAYQCRAPAISSVPTITPDSKPRNVPTTGYTLALSWSPEFCKPRENSPAHRVQCSGSNGRFGMVVHGLWPQWCCQQNKLTPAQLRKAMCMMPSARLIARQWAKHGSCMTKKPETYFGVTRILWRAFASRNTTGSAARTASPSAASAALLPARTPEFRQARWALSSISAVGCRSYACAIPNAFAPRAATIAALAPRTPRARRSGAGFRGRALGNW